VFRLGTDQRGMGTPTPSSHAANSCTELYLNPGTAIRYRCHPVLSGPELVDNSDEFLEFIVGTSNVIGGELGILVVSHF
jgi:hypothetical protein